MEGVECRFYSNLPPRNLLGIEFYEKGAESSLEADWRALWRILCDSDFLRLERLEFYDDST